MLCPNVRVIIFEDDPRASQAAISTIIRSGHKVVGNAASWEEATIILSTAVDLKPDVAVVNGQLGEERTQEDGVKISRNLRNALPDISIIAFTKKPAEGFFLGEIISAL